MSNAIFILFSLLCRQTVVWKWYKYSSYALEDSIADALIHNHISVYADF